MSGLLFVSQAILDSWAEQGKIEFVGNVMTLLGGDGKGRSYALEPAVRFLKVLGDERDRYALLHKVKSVAQLKELGGDPAGDSCLLGDVGYEVQPGFLAETSALHAAVRSPEPAARPTPGAASARSRPLGAGPLPRELEDRRKEAEALARFLLEKLS
jgi:hypothetical protein